MKRRAFESAIGLVAEKANLNLEAAWHSRPELLSSLRAAFYVDAFGSGNPVGDLFACSCAFLWRFMLGDFEYITCYVRLVLHVSQIPLQTMKSL